MADLLGSVADEKRRSGAALAASYRFDEVEVRPQQRAVFVKGAPVTLGSRAFDVLITLIGHADRILSKNELMDIVWPDVVVEENNLQVQISSLRKLLGPRAIATIPGRGYRFVAPLAGAVDEVDAAAEPSSESEPHAMPAAPAGNLSASLEPLLGRASELARLCEQVRAHRLVTLLGPGGIGKTTLARATAQAVAADFRDGAWFVELAAVTDPAALPGTVARSLRFNLPGQAQALLDLAACLRGHELLVLDNCEHLIEAASAMIKSLLDGLPNLHILVTSQEPLKIAAERVMRLEALAVPSQTTLTEAADYGAVALLTARIGAADPSFEVTAANLDAVIDICRQLDGMPLALELAAARVPLLGVGGVRERLAERFRLLRNEARDAPSRHRTLRATLDWSHALLSAPEQTVFRRLGIFVGGFSLELAQKVVADATIDVWAVLDHLGTLIDKSMVVIDNGGSPRYRLLESARAYAREQLEAAGEWPTLRRTHAEGLLWLVHRPLRAKRHGAESTDQWLLACGPEIDNLRSAIDWASGPNGDVALALNLVNVSAVLMYQAGRYPECVRWLVTAEPLIDEGTPAHVVAQFRLGLALVGIHGGVDTARRMALLDQARQTFEADASYHLLVLTLCLQAYVSSIRGDFAVAEASLVRSGEVIEQQALGMLQGLRLFNMGMVRRHQGRTDEALAAFEQSLPLVRGGGDMRTLFYVLNNLAATHLELGRVDAALARYEAVLELAQGSLRADAQMTAFALMWQLHALTIQGSLEAARAKVAQAVPHCRRSVGVRHFAGMLALLAARLGRLRLAALLVGCDEAAIHRRGEIRMPSAARTLEATLALVDTGTTPELVEAWRKEGGALGEDETIALVAELALEPVSPAG